MTDLIITICFTLLALLTAFCWIMWYRAEWKLKALQEQLKIADEAIYTLAQEKEMQYFRLLLKQPTDDVLDIEAFDESGHKIEVRRF